METSMLTKIEVPSWQYDEFKHPGEDFDIEAKTYDKKLPKVRNIQEETKEIIKLLNIQPDQTILEMGAGTGEFTVAVAEYCSKVLAVDLSLDMLRIAERKAQSKDLKNIEFIQGGFLTYEHNRKPVDVVVSQLSLHYLPDFWKQIALIRLSKMMKADARLLLYDSVYSFHLENYQDIFNGLISYMNTIEEKDTIDNTVNHIKEEYSTIDWIMEGMIRRAGFKIEKAEYRYGMFAMYLCTKFA
jgi:ubiquinone/menaquinone biosynthesis C-methylase UbiE